MIALLLLSCFSSNPPTAELPAKRIQTPMVSHKVQYGDLKGHLFSKGKQATLGYVLVGANTNTSCIEDKITEGQRIIAIEDKTKQEKAKAYLKGQVQGEVMIQPLLSYCDQKP